MSVDSICFRLAGLSLRTIVGMRVDDVDQIGRGGVRVWKEETDEARKLVAALSTRVGAAR